MKKLRPLLPELLRIALAALVLLGGLAGARMQGEMGAVALAGGGAGVLCSGAGRIADPLQGPEQHSHDQCIICPLAADLPPPVPAVPARLVAVATYRVFAEAQPDAARPVNNRARGPPQAG